MRIIQLEDIPRDLTTTYYYLLLRTTTYYYLLLRTTTYYYLLLTAYYLQLTTTYYYILLLTTADLLLLTKGCPSSKRPTRRTLVCSTYTSSSILWDRPSPHPHPFSLSLPHLIHTISTPLYTHPTHAWTIFPWPPVPSLPSTARAVGGQPH